VAWVEIAAHSLNDRAGGGHFLPCLGRARIPANPTTIGASFGVHWFRCHQFRQSRRRKEGSALTLLWARLFTQGINSIFSALELRREAFCNLTSFDPQLRGWVRGVHACTSRSFVTMDAPDHNEGVPVTTIVSVSLRMTFAVFGESCLLLMDSSSFCFLFISAIRTSFSIELTYDQMLSDSSS